MMQQRILEEIILSAERVIQDHILIKDLAENILTDSLQLNVKQQELNEILSKSQQHLKSGTIIPIEKINKLVKEVNERTNEQETSWQKLQDQLDHACMKASCQRKLLPDMQAAQSERINSDDRRRLERKDLDEKDLQKENIDSCPLGFDNLVCYFETGTSLAQQHEVSSDMKDEDMQQSLRPIIQPATGKIFKTIKYKC